MAPSRSRSKKDEKNKQIVCFMCISPPQPCKSSTFTMKTWGRFLEHVPIWKTLEGPQAEIAKKYDARHSATINPDFAASEIPEHWGFHRICYSRFTDPQQIERAKSRIERKAKEKILQALTSQEDEPAAEKKPAPCSNSDRPFEVAPRSVHVLPNVCILCMKTKYRLCRLSGKRKREHLVTCSTPNASTLKQAAEDCGNEVLLKQIKDQDCAAIKVRYHLSCYSAFTRHLVKSTTRVKSEVVANYTPSFEVFAETVRSRIIEDKEVMKLKKLNELFIKQIKETQGVDASTYKTAVLKQRLLKKFPQVRFISPSQRSFGESVYVDKNSTSMEETDLQEPTETTTSETDDDDDTDVLLGDIQQETDQTPRNTNHHMFKMAMELKTLISEVEPSLPQTLDTLDSQEAGKPIPHVLYNFLAWIVGASKKPDTKKMVNVPASVHEKILSISRDIISLASIDCETENGELEIPSKDLFPALESEKEQGS